MRPLSFSHAEAVGLLTRQIEEFTSVASALDELALDELALLGPSLCHGWSRLDALVHVRLGLEEMAMATTFACSDSIDHDAASYWFSYADDSGSDPVPDILWLRRVASAHPRPASAMKHLAAVATGAVQAVRSMPESTIKWQNKVMTSGDFLATWVVELAIHQLDLAVDSSAPVGIGWARQTVEAVADAELPSDLDDPRAVLVGLDRSLPPPETEVPRAFPISL